MPNRFHGDAGTSAHDGAASPVFQIPGLAPALLRFLAITPFEQANLPLARALWRQGVAAAIDIGRSPAAWPALFATLASERSPGLGLRIPDGVSVADLLPPAAVRFVVVASESLPLPAAWSHLPVLAQVCSLGAAEQALQAGAVGLIAKGQESGGLSGNESSFVLLQRVVAFAESAGVPVWCQGGMALNTAAGAFASGAFGIVLDAVLAAFPESALSDELKARILAMDGSEVRDIAGYQVYARSQRESSGLDSLDAAAVRAALAGQGDVSLLPIGQDAALARGVLAQCSTIDALINTLRARVAGHLHQAKALRVLDAGNAWAQSHGTRYPVAQGPMTRVSDTAAFSAAVAEAGGLPFLALSLMKEGPSRALLEATRDQVGSRPWGVGVLGFASPDILEPQLALVKEIRPSVLILAGGRPSQARPFIEIGIATYLHVPSPGLLDIFLKDGATHFVFEGRECGGHVGPRYSFVLWEQALSLLLEHEHPEQLHILFAGGIHDARSSAMVAAIAAPLAARGAKIGVLMGTAYIATEEAVSCGTVLEGFQRKALSGDTTALVETAPGHAIRCLPSGFMDLFAREKSRLQQEGVEQKEAWKALESLTVGRLRIATKGVDYVDGALAAVDVTRQEAEGMYMIGQVIAMKREVTTVAALHDEVSCGAVRYLDGIQAPALPRAVGAEPVAVVGMACLYAGSPDLETFWGNILEGRDLVSEVPAERWNIQQYYRGAGAPADKSVSKWGGFIGDTPFDPLAFGIPPSSLAAIEPVQLLSLEVSRQALKDAGYDARWFDRERTSVIFGAEAGMDLGNQYNFRNLYPQYCGDMPEALAQALPALTEDSFPGMLVNVISGRIANRLGFGGVNYAVTSACASSLTAIELAVKELRAGSSEMVLAGGADFHNGISDFLLFSSVGALSAKGRCQSFDNEADGIALGEGIGVVVLKRLADAERDGDRIYAVIDGIAGSSDGKGLGLTAPRKEGQKRALERTYWQAGVLPSEIGLVEAHGTGTVVGDRTELQTLTEVFAAGGALPGQTGLGSVKSQIGHTKCAAGIAGFIKVAKALHHRVLPATQQITSPNAWYRRETSPFQLNALPVPWLASAQRPARAAVSAFGFGGTNFHTVLSAYPAHQSAIGAHVLPAELFIIRGYQVADAEQVLRQLAQFLAASTAPLSLRDLARTAWEAGLGPVQMAFVADSLAALSAGIAAALARAQGTGINYRDATVGTGRVACLFSGQGSQYPGMLRDLFVYFPALQDVLSAGADYLPVIYPTTAYDDATRLQQQRQLTDTRNAQPALGLVELAAFRWLQALGVQPDMAAGHSYGELAALAAAGAFDAETLVALSRARADAIMASVGADAGSMAAVSLDVDALGPLLNDFPAVVMANQNSPVQTVISGPTADVLAATAHIKAQGIGCKPIDTACAFHSPLMTAAEQRYAAVLADQAVGGLQWPVYSNMTAAPHADDAAAIRTSLARHIVSPVRFVAEIERMHADGAGIFIEIGPRKVLTGLVGRILKDKPHVALAIDQEGQGLAGLFGTVARLAVLLPTFDATSLFAGRARVLDMAAPRKLAATTWMINGGRAWPLHGKPPAHAAAVVLTPVVTASAQPTGLLPSALPVSLAATAGEQAIVGYLANMRELVHAQRDVLLGFLGAPAPAMTAATPLPYAVAPTQVVTSSAALPASVQAVAQTAAAPDFRAVLLAIVSERTGYPADMLDLDLDLEADLSIDSIKRLEIIGELSQRLALRRAIGADADVLLEQLAAQKTLRAVLDWLQSKVPVVSAAPVVMAAPAATTAMLTQDYRGVLLAIVSERTGYPADMLDLDLDLEADLSIDSIKRLEIIGELSQRLALRSAIGADADVLLEQLAAQKTLRAVLDWLQSKVPAATPAAPVLATAPPVVTAAVPVADVLLDIVSQCTGYPVEALDLDLDLEADLSIDSIKRLEIVGQLTSRIGVNDGSQNRDVMLDSLAAQKTLRAMIAWLEPHDTAAVSVSASASVTALAAASDAEDAGIPLARYVLRRQEVAAALPAGLSLTGKHFLITDDSLGIAPRVAEQLVTQGATVQIIDFAEHAALPGGLERVDGLIHLWSLNPDNRVRDVKRFFAVVRDALLHKAQHVLVASGLGGDFGAAGTDFGRGGGLAGLVKSVCKEFPALRAHWVDLDLSEPQGILVQYLMSELLAGNPLPEVAWQAGHRYAREVVPAALDTSSLDALPLTPDSVVLLTGGARGITALIATALARRYRCHLEMVGRSAPPAGEETATTRGIDDPRHLRQALLADDAARKPADVERLARRILAERDFRATMAQVRAAGSTVNYTAMDVREGEAFSGFIADVYARHGRIDGVIHGAGVVEDKLVRDKTDESFGRVFDTKVRGALILNQQIRDDVRFVVFFSSVASAFGNRGQVDYASANDVLDKLAHAWQARIDGRVLSVNWGPWADTGMVSESLKNEYARKGIGLIPQRQGVDALLHELASGGSDTQVLLMCGTPESFDGRAQPAVAGA